MKKLVLAIHGLGGRGAWFDNLVKELESDEIKFYCPDLQGFGENEPRGHLDSYQQWLDQIESKYIDLKNKYPKTEFILLGHSLGAVILSNLKIDPEDKLIFSVPGFKGAKSTFSLAFTIKTTWQLFEDRFIKNKDRLIRLPSSKDKTDATDDDPLKVYDVSPNLLWQILIMSEKLKEKLSKFKNPILLIQVENDLVVNNQAMNELITQMPAQEKSILELKNTEHDWIWDQKAVSQAAPEILSFINNSLCKQ